MEENKELVPVKIVLTKEQEAQIFKSLVHQTYKEAGYEYGIHLMFPNNDIRVTSYVSEIAKKIKKAPEVWGISEDVVEVVQEALDSRSIKKNPNYNSDVAIQEESFRDKLDGMRDKVAELITRKLKKYDSAKGIDNVQLRDLKDLLGMVIDKGRLLRGESTENIKKLSLIDVEKLEPKDALAIIMKARDALIEGRK